MGGSDMDSEDTGTWACEAYGQELMQLAGVKCFIGPDNARGRLCSSREECSQVLRRRRQTLFQRINEIAAGGDPVAEYLADRFTTPRQLLSSDGHEAEGP